jgi:hypothetical protein
VRLIKPGSNDALSRAFDAARSQLTVASRKYLRLQSLSFGSLGTVGSAVHPCAIEAWLVAPLHIYYRNSYSCIHTINRTKATNGKITKFDDGSHSLQAIDAGRIILEADAPPIYQGVGSGPGDLPAVLSSQDLERGRERLSALAEQSRLRRAEIEATELAAGNDLSINGEELISTPPASGIRQLAV